MPAVVPHDGSTVIAGGALMFRRKVSGWSVAFCLLDPPREGMCTTELHLVESKRSYRDEGQSSYGRTATGRVEFIVSGI